MHEDLLLVLLPALKRLDVDVFAYILRQGRLNKLNVFTAGDLYGITQRTSEKEEKEILMDENEKKG